jgi:hypothetical protein
MHANKVKCKHTYIMLALIVQLPILMEQVILPEEIHFATVINNPIDKRNYLQGLLLLLTTNVRRNLISHE